MSVKYLFKERLEALWNFGLKPEKSGDAAADGSNAVDASNSKTVEGSFAAPCLC